MLLYTEFCNLKRENYMTDYGIEWGFVPKTWNLYF